MEYAEGEVPWSKRQETKAAGITTYDCVRAAIPDASAELCEHIIWGRTPYPFAKLTARDFYKAASGFRRAGANGIRLCDWCRRPSVDGWTCKPCGEDRWRDS